MGSGKVMLKRSWKTSLLHSLLLQNQNSLQELVSYSEHLEVKDHKIESKTGQADLCDTGQSGSVQMLSSGVTDTPTSNPPAALRGWCAVPGRREARCEAGAAERERKPGRTANVQRHAAIWRGAKRTPRTKRRRFCPGRSSRRGTAAKRFLPAAGARPSACPG